jgi:Tannase and feruloyl esterase
MNAQRAFALLLIAGLGIAGNLAFVGGQTPVPADNKTLPDTDCTAEKIGTTIPVSSIGEPVAAVTLDAPRWFAGSGIAYCQVDGTIAPVDTSANGRPINFRVLLPASWSRRAVQSGGGGFNGSIPNLTFGETGTLFRQEGFAVYGSDSGHNQRDLRETPDWTLSDEAIKNLGYMQMKKTHDAAIVLMQRVYGESPRYNYFIGTSQGGREALTVAQRYPQDYNGVAANVPILGFSTLMLAPELIRIQEKPSANWVTPAKVNAIRGEFIRQCDKLDGLTDGIINNYMACRAIFDVSQGNPNRNPWSEKRCPNNMDPNPADTTNAACLTDGQIATLKLVYSHYRYSTSLANGVKSFGMWTPTTDPSGSGLILPNRFKGQEGAAENAAMHSHLGVLGVTGFLMKNVSANPLDYVEGGPLNARREELSQWLDSNNPDLSAFARRGGKVIVAIGTNDTLASPGAQLDYYQALVDKMGRTQLDSFARLFVLPQTGHGLNGSNYSLDGEGKTIPAAPIPNSWDRVSILMNWVERGVAPGMSERVTAGERSLPLCSYPTSPKYVSGPVTQANSYRCE